MNNYFCIKHIVNSYKYGVVGSVSVSVSENMQILIYKLWPIIFNAVSPSTIVSALIIFTKCDRNNSLKFLLFTKKFAKHFYNINHQLVFIL